MRKAMLLYNPLSGRSLEHRLADVETALSVLRSAGVEASAAPTRAASDATEQTKQAIAEGCDAVFACGGDGTVHDVLQGLVGTNVSLAIIPLGTANCLAHDLRLPLSPARAAEVSLAGKPRRIAIGRIEYQGFNGKPATRYFSFIVGIGVDAHLFYKLDPLIKRRFGMIAYCAKATRLWLTHKMKNFAVGIAGEEHVEVSQLLAVRIGNFGGVLRELAPGASLDRDDLRFVLFRTSSRLAYLRYILRGLFGTNWRVAGIELVFGTNLICRDLSDSRTLVEADGELLGTLPAEISVVPNAVTLLAPH
ncbi:MAG: diacylglycerol kinase family protein [Terriglobales bacterium]